MSNLFHQTSIYSTEEILFLYENSAENVYRVLWPPSCGIEKESICSVIRPLGIEERSTEMMD